LEIRRSVVLRLDDADDFAENAVDVAGIGSIDGHRCLHLSAGSRQADRRWGDRESLQTCARTGLDSNRRVICGAYCADSADRERERERRSNILPSRVCHLSDLRSGTFLERIAIL